jgi:hypothetical protein
LIVPKKKTTGGAGGGRALAESRFTKETSCDIIEEVCQPKLK